jgi:cysteine desulfurase
MTNRPIYLDYNATTPIDREVADAMLPYLYERFGNPSSSHAYGREAREAVENARQQVAGLIGCQPDEVIFTSGGTEANNMVVKGVAEVYSARGGHIITSAIEHPAILEPCDYLSRRGCQITILPVDEYGRINPSDVERAITSRTVLVTIMLANNEVGTLEPIAEIAQIAHRHGVLVHTDAAQALGKVSVNVAELDVDFLTGAGHKLYAPKGVGFLYQRAGVQLPKFMHGAAQESGRRAGTENVLEIVGLGKACEIARRDLATNMTHLKAIRDRLYSSLVCGIDDIRLNGHPDERLPNTLSVGFRGVQANSLLAYLEGRVAVSAGAACHSDRVSVSAVLQAMNVPYEYALGTLRLSVGKMTTESEVDIAASEIAAAVQELREKPDGPR